MGICCWPKSRSGLQYFSKDGGVLGSRRGNSIDPVLEKFYRRIGRSPVYSSVPCLCSYCSGIYNLVQGPQIAIGKESTVGGSLVARLCGDTVFFRRINFGLCGSPTFGGYAPGLWPFVLRLFSSV